MPDMTDMELLRAYAERQSEPAFNELIQRHIRLVYSVAWRLVRNDQDAQDVTQAVFIILARKAAGLGPKTILTGWLYETTRFAAKNFLTSKTRRQQREQEAYMQSTLDDSAAAWRSLEPHLEEGMSKLTGRDRTLLVLCFYEHKTGAEAAAILGIREDAAYKRASRAIEKLRKFFVKRGVVISATAFMGTVSAHSLRAAPVGVTKTITAAAIAKGSVAPASILTLVKGTMKLMTWLKIKMAIAVGAALVLATGTTVVATRAVAQASNSSATIDDSAWDQMNPRVVAALPPAFILRQTHFNDGKGGMLKVGEKILGRAISFEALMGVAYGSDGSRVISPADKPTEKYDLLVTDPKVSIDQLQAEIKRQLGYVAHSEQKDEDVLSLERNQAGGPGLRVSQPANGGGGRTGATVTQSGSTRRTMKLMNVSIANFVKNLQVHFDKPILDHTGLDGTYDVTLEVVTNPGQSEKDALTRALSKQLGLELVPSHESVEILTVEKAP